MGVQDAARCPAVTMVRGGNRASGVRRSRMALTDRVNERYRQAWLMS